MVKTKDTRGNPLPALAKVIIKENENDFLSWVIDIAHLYHWKVAHFRGAWSKDGKRYMTPVQADGKGWPDLCLAREMPDGSCDIIFAELKSQIGKLSPEQKGWMEILSKNPATQCFVWKPSDRDEIKEILK